ncbi:MAG TPA: hypothetical protein VFZ04_20850, partial [Longimicrobiales bacterium]
PDTESRAHAQTPNRIAGAWRVAEVTRDSAGVQRTAPFPGLYLFTQNHYSMMRYDSEKPRRDFPDNMRRTTDTYIDIWGPLAAQTGKYEIRGDRIFAQPHVSKNPSAMKPESFLMFSWRIAGDTLWMQAVSDHNGPVANGTRVKLIRAER